MKLDDLINPELKEPYNAIGFIVIVAASAIHMAMVLEYQIPVWLTVVAIFMYPLGFCLFAISDIRKKNKRKKEDS